MKSIKSIIYVSVAFFVVCAHAMENIKNKSTRYVVRESWVRYNQEKNIEQLYENFNDIIAKIIDVSGSTQDKKSASSRYLQLRLQIMKAISTRVKACLIEKLNTSGKKQGTKNELHANDIEPDYIRNQEPALNVPADIETFVDQLITCPMLTDEKYFGILQPKANIFSQHKHFIKEDDNLPQLNRYLAWVEQLALVIFSDTPAIPRTQDIDRKLTAINSLGLKTSVFQLIRKQVEEIKNANLKKLLDASFEEFKTQERALAGEIPNQENYLNLLQEIVAFSNPRFQPIVSEQLEADSALKSKFTILQDNIIAVLKTEFKLKDAFIKEFTSAAVASFTKKYSDFLTNYNKLARAKDVNFSAVGRLAGYIKNYISRSKPTGNDLKKITELLEMVEALRNKPLTKGQAESLFYSLQLSLNTLSAFRK